MEFLNKIEVKGIVGRIDVKEVADSTCANFAVATDFCYKSREGQAIIDTTWFNVVAWKGENHGKKIVEFGKIHKGSAVHVIGRVRSRSYEGADGNVCRFYEIVASSVELLPDEN